MQKPFFDVSKEKDISIYLSKKRSKSNNNKNSYMTALANNLRTPRFIIRKESLIESFNNLIEARNYPKNDIKTNINKEESKKII